MIGMACICGGAIMVIEVSFIFLEMGLGMLVERELRWVLCLEELVWVLWWKWYLLLL